MFPDLLGCDAVFRIEGLLFFSAACGFVDGARHGIGDFIGVHDNAAVHVSRRPPRSLGEGSIGTEEALFIRIHDGHQRNFGNIQAFPQQIDPYQHIEHPIAQLPNDFHTVQCLYIRVDVARRNAEPVEVFGEFLSHALGQGRHEDAIALINGLSNFSDEVIHLMGAGSHVDGRVQKAGWTDDLLHDDALRLFQFIIGRGCRDVNDLVRDAVEFVGFQWAIVQCGGQPKPVFHQGSFSGAVTSKHGPDLWDCDVAFIHHQ